MSWRIDFSSEAVKFLRHNHTEENDIIEHIKRAIRKFNGEDISVNIKKLGGTWEGFYRIRSGKMRIIVEFQFEHSRAYIEKIDWRGSAYK